MFNKKWIKNTLYLVIIVLAFSLSLFKWDNQVWIAAWIAPFLLIRFMRTNKLSFGIILGFIALQLAVSIGMMPILMSVDMESTSSAVGPMFFVEGSAKSGTLFLAPLFLLPFILDKIFYKRLPKTLACLVFPTSLVAVESLYSLSIGTLFTFGQSQYSIQALTMTASLFGLIFISFIIGWSASIINRLWEENWNIRKLGASGLIYICVMVLALTYGAVKIVFPQKIEKTVPVAGIILDTEFGDRVFETGFNFLDDSTELSDYVDIMKSSDAHKEEVYSKTIKAIESGSKIIVWQELALTLEVSEVQEMLFDMKELAVKENVYILTAYGEIFDEKTQDNKIVSNMGVLITPEGESAWEYEKAYPVPGGEDIAVVAGVADIPYYDTPYGRLGQATCFDLHYSQYLKQASDKKIDLLLDPSYDGSEYTPLHSFNGGFRAVENGFTLFRVTGNGYSCVIDPYYRIWFAKNSLETDNNNFYYDVPIVSFDTFYGTIGYIFPYINIGLLLLLIILGIIKPTTKKNK